MLNTCSLVGNLGQDPKVQTSANGKEFGNFSLAFRTRSKDQQTGKQKTGWIRVTVFGEVAKNCGNYLAKGSKVAVSGSLDYNTFTDKAGNNRTEIVLIANDVEFLDRKGENSGNSQGNYQNSGQNSNYRAQNGGQQNNYRGRQASPSEDLPMMDDVPF